MLSLKKHGIPGLVQNRPILGNTFGESPETPILADLLWVQELLEKSCGHASVTLV
jgi:hypothetical protein